MSIKAARPVLPSLVPCLRVADVSRAVEFYRQVFDATVLFRQQRPNGRTISAHMRVGESTMLILPLYEAGGGHSELALYVVDVDETMRRAVTGGATESSPVEDGFDGDRSGGFYDPFGHYWFISTCLEELEVEEVYQRGARRLGELVRSAKELR